MAQTIKPASIPVAERRRRDGLDNDCKSPVLFNTPVLISDDSTDYMVGVGVKHGELMKLPPEVGFYPIGDYFYMVDTQATRKCKSCGNEEDYIQSTKSTWLPTQAQLQEMLGKDFRKVLLARMGNGEYMGLDGFVEFAYEDADSTSMESLWLAFVMKELYQKQWTGSEWLTPSKK